jgi:hypothetical protein
VRCVSSSQSVFSPPAGGRQAEVTGASLCRIIGIAGSGWATDTAKLHNRTASRILMTIGVAKTIIANRPIASDAPQAPSQASLGFVPLPPSYQYTTPHRALSSLCHVPDRASALGSFSLDGRLGTSARVQLPPPHQTQHHSPKLVTFLNLPPR